MNITPKDLETLFGAPIMVSMHYVDPGEAGIYECDFRGYRRTEANTDRMVFPECTDKKRFDLWLGFRGSKNPGKIFYRYAPGREMSKGDILVYTDFDGFILDGATQEFKHSVISEAAEEKPRSGSALKTAIDTWNEMTEPQRKAFALLIGDADNLEDI